MKMKIIPSGNYFINDILEDLTSRYVNHAVMKQGHKIPEKESFRNGFIHEWKFYASRDIQQCLLDERMTAYFTDLEGIKKIPRGFWRDKIGNDAIFSGMTPDCLSAESEWIYVGQHEYGEILTLLDIADIAGNSAFFEPKPHGKNMLRRRPMQEADIPQAVDLLRQEILSKNLTRPQREIFLRQSFTDIDIKEPEMREILRQVPARRGRPRKSDGTSQ